VKKIKWYEEKENVTSSMRIMAMIGCCIGSMLALSSIILSFINNNYCITIGGFGVAILTGSQYFKKKQTEIE
jgi:hypothetical protein